MAARGQKGQLQCSAASWGLSEGCRPRSGGLAQVPQAGLGAHPGPVRQAEPVLKGGPVCFLPSENSCCGRQNLTSFFAKILFDVNIVLLRLITFFLYVKGYESLHLFLLGFGTIQMALSYELGGSVTQVI